MSTPTVLMTTEEFLDLPDDGIDRELIRGELREERPEDSMARNPAHCSAAANVCGLLGAWLRKKPAPRGRLHTGDAAFRIRCNPDTTVGIDVAYAGPDLAASTPRNARVVDGPPILAVEVLSPSDRHEKIVERVQGYLDAGVAAVWVVDTDFETVRIHRAGEPIRLLSGDDELSAEPFLPGFRARVADIFSV